MGTSSGVSVIEKVLMEGGGEKVVKRRVWIRAICLPHRLHTYGGGHPNPILIRPENSLTPPLSN